MAVSATLSIKTNNDYSHRKHFETMHSIILPFLFYFISISFLYDLRYLIQKSLQTSRILMTALFQVQMHGELL